MLAQSLLASALYLMVMTAHRELGVEFGELRNELDGVSYPITNEELIESYGDTKLDLPNGTETLSEVLGSLERESYLDTADVSQAIFTMIGEGAIGRKFYSDRDPPALGEDYPNSVSF